MESSSNKSTASWKRNNIIFIGIPATGKSTFYQKNFADTHIRVNLDMLKTRNRESKLIQFCIETEQPMVIDNTNPSKKEREKYFPLLKKVKMPIIGFYFQANLDICIKRNEKRLDKNLPKVAVIASYQRLEIPSMNEGFDKLFSVHITEDRAFKITDWKERK